jgi:hypothetical protein
MPAAECLNGWCKINLIPADTKFPFNQYTGCQTAEF